MTGELFVLRLIHVVGGMLWVGAGAFMTFFLLPALAGSGPTVGQVMAGLERRRFFTVLPVVALLTIGSGVRLLQLVSAGFTPAYFESRSGLTFAVAGAATIIAFVLSLLVSRPAGARTARLAAALATAAPADRGAIQQEMESLRRRASISSSIAMFLLLAGAAGMAVGRYL